MARETQSAWFEAASRIAAAIPWGCDEESRGRVEGRELCGCIAIDSRIDRWRDVLGHDVKLLHRGLSGATEGKTERVGS